MPASKPCPPGIGTGRRARRLQITGSHKTEVLKVCAMNDKAKPIQNGRSRGAYKHAAWSRVTDLCTCAAEDALRQLETGRLGLTEEQVEARREQYGMNEVTHEKPATWYAQLFHAFLTPFNGVL